MIDHHNYTQSLKQLENNSSLSGIRAHDLCDTFATFKPLRASHVLKSPRDQLPVSWIAQLVENCIGIPEVMGSNPVQAWI